MKSLVKLCSLLLLVVHFSVSAQPIQENQAIKILNKSVANNDQSPNSPAAFKNLINNNGYISSSTVAPFGTQRYIRTVYIISASELAAAGVVNGSKFYSWGFNYYTAPSAATTGNFKLYLQNTKDTAYSKASATWTNGTDGIVDPMTLVNDGNFTMPAAAGPVDITLTNGTAFTYTGGALYVAFDYQNAAGSIITTVNRVLVNTTTVGGSNGSRYAYSTTALPTAIAYTSASRPETRAGFTTGIATDASVDALFSYGKLATNLSSAPLSAQISNLGDNALTNVSVTLSITGANTFTSTKVIASIPRDGASIVTFDPFIPTVSGVNTVTVSVPADGKNTNNSKTSKLYSTTGSITCADSTTQTNSIGFGTGAGLLLTKYTIKGSTTVNSVTVTLGSTTSGSTGNTVFAAVLDDAGKILAQSANYVILAADLGKTHVFTFTTPVSVKDQNIYVGLGQTANATTGYYPIGTQDELAGRPGVYYSAALTGGAYTDESGNGLVFMVEANVTPASVPVELTSFSSNVNNGVVTLKWSTATETNNSGFQIERKAVNATEWTVVGSVKGNGTSAKFNSYSYSDNVSKLAAGSLNYRLKQIDFDGTSKYYALSNAVEISAPVNFSLAQNFPNPFNPTTSISFSVASDSKVKLEVFDVLGKVVKTLVNETKAAGNYTVNFDASNLSSGVYMYKISAGNFTATKKMNLMK